MKKNSLTKYFFILFSIFMISSCTQRELIDDAVLNPIPNLNNPTANFFKVKMNGTVYNSATFSAVKADGKFLINASRGSGGENIFITINGTAVGVYQTSSDVIIYKPNTASAYDYVSYLTIGTTTTHNALIEITAINTTTKRIAGTIDFVGYWANFNQPTQVPPINFTNGKFEMPYSE